MKIQGIPVNISTNKEIDKKSENSYEITEFTLLIGTDVYACVSFREKFEVVPDIEQEFTVHVIAGKQGMFQVMV